MTTPPRPLRLRFRRFECKYRITQAQARSIMAYAGPHVEPDPFAALAQNKTYEISSLYLDSPALRLYQETVDGICDRFKLRIRAYTDRPNDPLFLEIKRRSDRVILKQRARMRRADLAALLAGSAISVDAMRREEQECLEAFRLRQDRLGAVPQVQVRYRREAYQGLFDPSVRITFDRDIRARRVDRPHGFFDPVGWQAVESRRIVLELKFNEQCPRWMTEVIRIAALHRTSYSKYALSVDAVTDARTMHM